ncbi:hypothetical protein EKO27_g7786 [Xylaria grammica]|uniref:NADH dehydrogenase [ubiquinone] 1 beta subcomplex subunit 9 n=1 Tax=Xylaria grammica TaxID=363999 RepID=A0A439CYU5_9PEZI|nr:hypothetical protein EKO27_g7786 [Xylaria grammica]
MVIANEPMASGQLETCGPSLHRPPPNIHGRLSSALVVRAREYSFKRTTPLAQPRHLDNPLHSPLHPAFICYDRNTADYHNVAITPHPSTHTEGHEGTQTKGPIMSNRQAALSLYRRALKISLDWAVHRQLWRGQALYIRSLFEANRNVKDLRQQRALLQETEKLLKTWGHPDPYCAPTAPGGSKFERNLPAHTTDPPPPLKF